MDPFDSTFKPLLVPGLIQERRGELSLLIHPEVPTWTVVNRLGVEVIRLSDGRRDIATITARLAQIYHRPDGEILPDVTRFLDQLDKARMLLRDAKSPPVAPLPQRLDVVSVNVTDRCNLTCRHCGVVPRAAGPSALESGQIRRLVDEARDLGAREFTLSGGEPMVREDWADLLRYAAAKFRVVHLFTNATLIDQERARLIADLGVDIQISLDGASDAVHDNLRGQGAFGRTLEGIENLRRSGAGERITINYCVMRINLDNIFPTLDLAEEMGISLVRFLPVSRIGRARESWAEMSVDREDAIALYERLYRWAFTATGSLRIDPGLKGFHLRVRNPDDPYRTCPLGSRLLVDADGGIYPCPCLMTDTYRIGNAAEAGLTGALRSERLSRLWAAFTGRRDAISKCRTCPWRQLCGAACAGRVIQQTGRLNEVDDLCDLRRRLYPEAIFALAGRRPTPGRFESESWC